MITDEQAAALVQAALQIPPPAIHRQGQTQSGNAIFRAVLADGQSLVLRVSPGRRTFAYTQHNLTVLRELGLPVQTVRATGPTAAGGSFILLSWLPGRDLLYELRAMRPDQVTRLAQRIVDLQQRIGSLPQARAFGWAPIGQNPATARWTDIFGPPPQPGTSDVSPDAPRLERLRARLCAIRQTLEPYFASVRPTCFLDDLTIKNVLIENGELTGIIDVDFVCYGDPLMSVGTTLALLAAEVGGGGGGDDAGRFYGDELLRSWSPSPDGLRAVRFYAALWTIGFLSAAADAPRADALATIADAMLRLAETEQPPLPLTLDQRLEHATRYHRAGNLPEARRLYQQVLAEAPAHEVARFRMGLLELQDGHPEAALVLIQQAIAAAPMEPRYQFGLGEILAALRRWEDAAAAYRRVLAADPRSANAHFALGVALQALHDLPAAIAAYETAVECRPDFIEALNNLGNCHQLRGDLPRAQAAYQRVLALQPQNTNALSNLGALLQAMGRAPEAVDLLRAAAALEPDDTGHAVNLGAALCANRNFAEAAALLRSACARDPNNPEAAYNLGHALHGLGQLSEAAAQYRRAADLRPDYFDALNNLGNVLKALGDYHAAMAAYDAALRAQPEAVVALNNAGCLLRTLGRLEEAEAILRRGLAHGTRHAALYNNLGNVLKDSGALDDAIDCFRQAVALDPADAAAHGNLAYALSFQSLDPAAIRDECTRFNDRHAAPLAAAIQPHAPDRTPGRRLRIGYVSPDFRDHCQSLFTIPLLSHHDHAAFEIFCYSSVVRPDDHTRRIARHADVWRDVAHLDDAALADRILADQIDILVDLTMHMADGRPLLFARKPAPLQVAWLAYPGTTGLAAIDYRFSDPRLDPAPPPPPSPACDAHYAERTLRLPDAFWCYDPLAEQPAVNPLPALTRGQLTLGCLNNPCKITDHTLHLWAPVLHALPHARLLLMMPPGAPRQRLLQRLASHGIAPDRIHFHAYRPRADYLQTYHDIDLGLDTFPYNGHTTSLDAFWMGVPVLTRVGPTCVGRGGLSQLFQLNLTDLAAETDDAFTRITVALANDLARLAALRLQLRPRLQASPLMNAPRFAKNIEAAYHHIWQRAGS